MFSKDLCSSCRRFLTKLSASKILKYNGRLVNEQNASLSDPQLSDNYFRKCSGCDKVFSLFHQVKGFSELNKPENNSDKFNEGIKEDVRLIGLSLKQIDQSNENVLAAAVIENDQTNKSAEEKSSKFKSDHSYASEQDANEKMDSESKSNGPFNVLTVDDKFHSLSMLAQVCYDIYEKTYLENSSSTRIQATESNLLPQASEQLANEHEKPSPQEHEVNPLKVDTMYEQMSVTSQANPMCLDQRIVDERQGQRESSSTKCESSEVNKVDKLQKWTDLIYSVESRQRVGLDEIKENIKSRYYIDKTKKQPYICGVDHNCNKSFSNANDVELHLFNHFYFFTCPKCGRFYKNLSKVCKHISRCKGSKMNPVNSKMGCSEESLYMCEYDELEYYKENQENCNVM